MSLSRFEEELLRAGASDSPSDERRSASRARVLEAAGFGAGAAAAAAGSKATTTAGGQALAVKSGLFAKLVVAGAVTLALGVVALVVPSSRAHAPPPSSTRPPSAVARVVSSSPSTARPEIPTSEVPSVDVSALPNATPPASSSRRLPSGDDLAAEVALLESARICVERADRACADASLTEHARRFPAGALREEAEVLRIELARKIGDEASARMRAEQFIQRSPSGPYAKRARRALEDLDGGLR